MMVQKAFKPAIIVVNKWDLVEEARAQRQAGDDGGFRDVRAEGAEGA